MSQDRLCEKRTAGDWPLLNHVICANGCRRHRGGISAILLVLSSLKYLKCSQTCTSFQGTGGTVTVENRAEFCSRQMSAYTPSMEIRDGFTTTSLFNGLLTIPGLRSKACCCATLAVSRNCLCERAVLGHPVLHCIRASCPSQRQAETSIAGNLGCACWHIKGGIIAIWQD